jgi:hypothetical protein
MGVLDEAERGNYASLIEQLRSAEPLSPEERKLAARIIEGSLKRPAHRPPLRGDKKYSQLFIAYSVASDESMGIPHKAAVANAVSPGLSESAIRKAVRAHPHLFPNLPKRPKRRSGK